VERIFDPAKVQDELDIYNALLPGRDELSATLLIEITEEAMNQASARSVHGARSRRKAAIVAGGERASEN